VADRGARVRGGAPPKHAAQRRAPLVVGGSKTEAPSAAADAADAAAAAPAREKVVQGGV